jgi:putative transposase
MANTWTCLHHHIVFSTRSRTPWITTDLQERVWAYLGGIIRQNDHHPLKIGGMPDHVHILLGLKPTMSMSETVKRIKGGSSEWIGELPGCRGFAWQDGYAAFAVSKSQVPEVEAYIRNQAEHHRVRTFQEEYREFLDKHGIMYDERYLWG